jgi:RPA family protein
MMVRRYVAKKARIADLTGGRYFPGGRGEDADSYKPSYVITPFGESVSRANLVATVTDKFISEDGNYASITLDDGTGAIRAKAFGEDVKLFEAIDKGSLVIVAGKMKEYQGEIYINAELVRAVEPGYETLRRLELLDQLSGRRTLVDNLRKMQKHMSDEDLKEYAKSAGMDEEAMAVVLEKKEADYKPKILEILDSLDDGNGVEISRLFDIVKLPEAVVERTIDELLDDGSLYEPTPGKFKKI